MVRLFNSCCSFREGHLSLEEREVEEEWVAITPALLQGIFVVYFWV